MKTKRVTSKTGWVETVRKALEAEGKISSRRVHRTKSGWRKIMKVKHKNFVLGQCAFRSKETE